jgi:hypothetical protein
LRTGHEPGLFSWPPTAQVDAVLQAISTGRVQASGSTGEPATFTDRVKGGHVIRNVLLRQIAIANYINPF